MRGSPQRPRGRRAAAPIGKFPGGIPRPFVAGDRPPAGSLHCRPVGTMASFLAARPHPTAGGRPPTDTARCRSAALIPTQGNCAHTSLKWNAKV